MLRSAAKTLAFEMFKTFENSSLKPVQAIKTTNTDDRYGPPTNAKTRRLAKRRLMREKDIAEASDPPVQAVVVEEISSPIPKPVILKTRTFISEAQSS